MHLASVHGMDRSLVSSEHVITCDTGQGRGDPDQPGLSPTATLLAPPRESFSSEEAIQPIGTGLTESELSPGTGGGMPRIAMGCHPTLQDPRDA